ncbi:LuxR C-terminal-related transcriptional regulator [Bacillus atrophaeus]|uniref:LuxR C-terminal-related transcriptional regulator n=1 Tax=Bacillus atrophaeus TaxID=1452 RepID=UPI00387344DD
MNLRDRIIRLEQTSASSSDYIEAVIKEIRTAIPFTASCCTAVDPETLLSIGSITDDQVESIHHQLFQSEYQDQDYNQYKAMVNTQKTAAILSEAAKGQINRSKRYQNILKPAGLEDELRAVLMTKGKCWGYITLLRRSGEPFFQPEERDLLAASAPVIGSALRQFRLALPNGTTQRIQDTGILIMSRTLGIISHNQTARKWLTVLRKWEKTDSETLPRPIRAVCTNAPENSTAKVLITIPDHPYLLLKASLLKSTAEPGQIAVSFEPAAPPDTMPLLIDACGLTERETDITDRIIRGLSTKEIAEDLHISAYTVQDHLKSIFAKTETGSRRELMWKMLSYVLE